MWLSPSINGISLEDLLMSQEPGIVCAWAYLIPKLYTKQWIWGDIPYSQNQLLWRIFHFWNGSMSIHQAVRNTRNFPRGLPSPAAVLSLQHRWGGETSWCADPDMANLRYPGMYGFPWKIQQTPRAYPFPSFMRLYEGIPFILHVWDSLKDFSHMKLPSPSFTVFSQIVSLAKEYFPWGCQTCAKKQPRPRSSPKQSEFMGLLPGNLT